MARGISLTRVEEALKPVPNRGDAFRVQIIASLAELMPNEVFLMRRNTRDAASGTTTDEFCAVASPEDLVNFPVNNPVTNSLPPFFRAAKIDVIVGSRDLAIRLWDEVHKRVCELVDALDRKDRLAIVEVVRCGAVEEPTSQSVSQSVSV